MKLFLLFYVAVLFQTAFARHFRLQQQQQQHVFASNEIQKLENLTVTPKLGIEIYTKCPLGCVCQYAQFFDLPISRWIQQTQMSHLVDNANIKNIAEFAKNPYMKQATCLLQDNTDPTMLVNALPNDIKALILLYTGGKNNKTVNTSIFKTLNQLTTLEIRGPIDRSFWLIFDEPLDFIKNANFESISLTGSDNFKRPKNPVHPSKSFNYKPRNFRFAAVLNNNEHENLSISTNSVESLNFGFEFEKEEILPYDIYVQEVKKARMPTFYGWHNLQILRINNCQLKELQWEMFDGLKNLQHLTLEHNEIEGIPAFALYGALHIKTLSLANNKINDLHYRALAGLLDLEILNLSFNRLGKLSEMSFPPFPKLKYVDFTYNPITNIYPATFFVMNGTEKLLLRSTDAPLELRGNVPFESLTKLKELFIGNISVITLEQNIFKDLISLEKLNLKGKLLKIDYDAFVDLLQMSYLDMSYCHIREISMDAFVGCKNLKTIDLAHNNLTYLTPGLFEDLNALEEIYLEDNQLKTLPLTFFKQPKLRLAHLHENPWHCNCDMANWQQKITNQQRITKVKRCIKDYLTGNDISCREVDNSYKFDHRYAPRCQNFNGRSVFYVVRKHLECNTERFKLNKKYAYNKQYATKTKYISQQKIKNNNNYITNYNYNDNIKIRKTNDINYALNKNQMKLNFNENENNNNEISNDIFI